MVFTTMKIAISSRAMMTTKAIVVANPARNCLLTMYPFREAAR
jgi:hypothetical protein